MHKHHRDGHIVMVVIALIAVAGIIGLALYTLQRRDTNTEAMRTDEPQKSATIDSQPVLQNLGLDTLDNVLITQNALREYSSQGLKGFYVFGEKLGGKSDTRLNPNFEFSSLKPGTKLISAIDGVVAFIREQPDTKDYEVFIQPTQKSAWTIGYDHVSNVAVKKDDKIKAGDFIGNPAMQNNGSLRFEIQINKDENGTTTHYCPSTLLSSTIKESILSSISSMQEQWNILAGQKLYDISKQDPTGCLKPTMSVAESEGR